MARPSQIAWLDPKVSGTGILRPHVPFRPHGGPVSQRQCHYII